MNGNNSDVSFRVRQFSLLIWWVSVISKNHFHSGITHFQVRCMNTPADLPVEDPPIMFIVELITEK